MTHDRERSNEQYLPSDLSIFPATPDNASLCAELFRQNRESLHAKEIPITEWRKMLSANDPDEEHYLIYKYDLPVAYMKLNGLSGENVWISMLFVSADHQRHGIGSFAVRRAEERAAKCGFESLRIQTTSDNTPARNLYKKLGYEETYDKGSGRYSYYKSLEQTQPSS